jgi:hypothetical protein
MLIKQSTNSYYHSNIKDYYEKSINFNHCLVCLRRAYLV